MESQSLSTTEGTFDSFWEFDWEIRNAIDGVDFPYVWKIPFPFHFLILSLFPLHFLIPSPFPCNQGARMPQFVQPCISLVPQPTCYWKWHPDTCQLGNPTILHQPKFGYLPGWHKLAGFLWTQKFPSILPSDAYLLVCNKSVVRITKIVTIKAS